MNQDHQFDRRAIDEAMIVKGRLQTALISAQFASERLQREDVREQAFCPVFQTDLLDSQTAIFGGTVFACSRRRR